MLLPDHSTLAERIRRIRRETFGEDGDEAVAEALGLPLRTWRNYEAGVTIPGAVLLGFVALTSASTRWLLTEEGPLLEDRSASAPIERPDRGDVFGPS